MPKVSTVDCCPPLPDTWFFMCGLSQRAVLSFEQSWQWSQKENQAVLSSPWWQETITNICLWLHWRSQGGEARLGGGTSAEAHLVSATKGGLLFRDQQAKGLFKIMPSLTYLLGLDQEIQNTNHTFSRLDNLWLSLFCFLENFLVYFIYIRKILAV